MGAKKEIEGIDGKIEIKIPERTLPGEVFKVKGEGVKYNQHTRGDLYVVIHLDIPKKLDKKAKKLLEELRELGV